MNLDLIPLPSDRLLPVCSDYMEPTLRMGRHMVAVRPVARLEGEGMYLIDDVITHCERSVAHPHPIRCWAHNEKYTPYQLTDEQFTQAVGGKVVAVIELLEHAPRQALWLAANEARRAV